MQENLVIRDPFTGQDQKKNAKHLMVQLSARRLESEQCIFPELEDTRLGIVGQLRNFKADKLNRDGIPVYNTMEDHALVAWQLAIMALILEFTDLARAQYSHKVEFADVYGRHPQTGHMGEKKDEEVFAFAKKPVSRTDIMRSMAGDIPAIVGNKDFRRPSRPLSKRVTF